MNELERLEKILEKLEDVSVKPSEIVENSLLASIARSLAIIADKLKEKDVKL